MSRGECEAACFATTTQQTEFCGVCDQTMERCEQVQVKVGELCEEKVMCKLANSKVIETSSEVR